MWPHIPTKGELPSFCSASRKEKKNDRSKEKKRFSTTTSKRSQYIRKKESSAVMILNHFVSFHITHLLIYIKVTQPQPEGFSFPLVQAGILQSSNYLTYLTYLIILLLHRPKGSLAEFPKKTRHVNSGRFYAWCKHGRY